MGSFYINKKSFSFIINVKRRIICSKWRKNEKGNSVADNRQCCVAFSLITLSGFPSTQKAKASRLSPAFEFNQSVNLNFCNNLKT